MTRHLLSKQEMLKGAEKALKSKKLPRQFRAGVRKLRDRLRSELGKNNSKWSLF